MPVNFDRDSVLMEDGRNPSQSAPEGRRSDDSPSSSDNGDFKKLLLARPNRVRIQLSS